MTMNDNKNLNQPRLTRTDILTPESFEKHRRDHRGDLISMKKQRRVHIGPDATFYFENLETIWWQIHEMLRIEKGGEQQIIDELEAYVPLVPTGSELVATLMFEIDDPIRRTSMLNCLSGVENTISIGIEGSRIEALPEIDDGVSRTTAKGKTSSIHFIRFPFSENDVMQFGNPLTKVVLAIEHEHYGHMAVLPKKTKEHLQKDFYKS